jgi:hypothetical protein
MTVGPSTSFDAPITVIQILFTLAVSVRRIWMRMISESKEVLGQGKKAAATGAPRITTEDHIVGRTCETRGPI